MNVAAVVIGRNEGTRLVACLKSLKPQVSHIVYVDSGSTDGSIEAARDLGCTVVDLDLSRPFSAARARNAGMAQFGDDMPNYLQLVDGDCEIRPDWIEKATTFLDAQSDVGAVAGRLRERHPEVSIWNRLTDDEWNDPPGETEATTGTMMLRREAIADVGGFRDELIAGEDPEMCLRLRRAGWKIWRLADEMALHDIEMTRLGQWWTRMRRGGHAYAEVAALHWGGGERFRVRETGRALLWGAALPITALLAAMFLSPWWLLLLLAWPLQVARLNLLKGFPLYRAFFLTLGKLPEAQGAAGYWLGRVTGRRQKLIEYREPQG